MDARDFLALARQVSLDVTGIPEEAGKRGQTEPIPLFG
jgi:hypothetical protein